MNGEPWHGTMNGYNNYGCRCEDCRTECATATKRYRTTGTYRDATSHFQQKVATAEHATSLVEWRAYQQQNKL